MQPREVAEEWVRRFNRADIHGLIDLYTEDAINHQVVAEPLRGREAILEWSDPPGLRGSGFFQVKNDRIVFQRGYFDQLSFFRVQNLPVPDTYLGT